MKTLAVLLSLLSCVLWVGAEETLCPDLEPENGTTMVCFNPREREEVECSSANYTEGVVVTFFCPDSYIREDGEVCRTCQSNGTWTGSENLRCVKDCGVAKTDKLPWNALIYIDPRYECVEPSPATTTTTSTTTEYSTTSYRTTSDSGDNYYRSSTAYYGNDGDASEGGYYGNDYADDSESAGRRKRYTVGNDTHPTFGGYHAHCSGTLIEERVVITAARCVTYERTNYVMSPRVFNLTFGEQYDDDGEGNYQIRQVKAIRMHPHYNPLTLKHDIALILLDEPVQVNDYISPICVDHEYDPDDLHAESGDEGLVMRFWAHGSREDQEDFEHQDYLHYDYLSTKSVPAISDEDCYAEMDPEQTERFELLTPNRYCGGFYRNQSDSVELCPQGWEAFEGHCYKMSHSAKTWDDARSSCEDKGGYLATVRSEEEFNVISKYLRYNMWAGLHSKSGEEWEWTDGSTVNFEYLPGFGDGSDASSPNSNKCLDVIRSGSGFSYARDPCDSVYQHNFICKLAANGEDQQCPDNDWELFEDACYYTRDTRQLYWNDARDACKEHHPDADLPSILSNEELEFFRAKIQDNVWIGLYTDDYGWAGKSYWRWVDSNSDVSYDRWQSEYPREERGMCGEMQSYGWVNSDCSEEKYYVCEVPQQGEAIETACHASIGGGMAYKEVKEVGERWHLEGITSYKLVTDDGALQCTDRQSGVNLFTRVDYYHAFINDVLEYFKYYEPEYARK